MAKGSSFHDFVMSELFADIEGIRSRSIYEKYDSKPFVYTGHRGKDIALSYYELPADIMDDRNELIRWVNKSISVAKVKK